MINIIFSLLFLPFSQTVLCGMGELHIEIIHDRIKREYGLETYLGPLQVAYRETILNSVHATGKKCKAMQGTGAVVQGHSICLA